MTERLGLVAAYSKPEAQELATTITQWLDTRGLQAVAETDIVAEPQPNVDAIIVLGGDGLMMRMAKAFPDIPLIGINFGKVGFLALVEQADWQQALELFLSGNYDLDESSTLNSEIVKDGKPTDQGWAINDVVIRAGLRMIEVEVYIDGYFVNQYPSDGLIISTPRGSTAYCMAAGGPILTPGVKGFAVVPISSHSPIRTPMIASEDSVIELVTANTHKANLILDGERTSYLDQYDVVKVTKGEHVFRLVRVNTTSFYTAFREKFNFATRPNTIPSRLSRQGPQPNS